MGFYYDMQLNNLGMTVRLYSNTEYDPTQKKFNDRGSYNNLLARAIFNEDFQVEVNNNWTQFDGGNFIEGIWNNVKPWAAVVNSTLDKADGITVKEDDDSFLGKGMNLLAKAKDVVQKHSSYLDKALIVQGTRFSYYSGTDIGISNMTLRYTVFYNPYNKQTVHDQLDQIRPYVIGNYVPIKDDPLVNDMTKGNETAESVKSILGEMIGWQDPPGGFKSSVRTVGFDNIGTLKLEFGTKYAISNLVIKGMSTVYSRHSAKIVPVAGSIMSAISTPLYADVILQLQPVGIITENMLSNYMRGLDMSKETLEEMSKKNAGSNKL